MGYRFARIKVVISILPEFGKRYDLTLEWTPNDVNEQLAQDLLQKWRDDAYKAPDDGGPTIGE